MRARNIKPGFFENEELLELPIIARLLFIGLWCFADCKGRFEWKPKKIKLAIFPIDNEDVESALQQLIDCDLIYQYSVRNKNYGIIPKFLEHQSPHKNETQSKIPAPPPIYAKNPEFITEKFLRTVTWDEAKKYIWMRDGNVCLNCGQTGNLSVDHINPLSKGGADRDPENLQTLCCSCNSKKYNKTPLEYPKTLPESSGKGFEAYQPLHETSRNGSLNDDIRNPDIRNPDSLNPEKKEKDISSELQKNEAHEPPVSAILEIPLISKNGKVKTFPIFQKDIDQWQSVFPALDVLARIKLIRQWNIDNPQRRKTARGIKQHITSWLERDQNSGKFKPGPGAGSNIANLNKMALLILECDGAENFERYCIENGLDAKQLKVPP